MRVGSNAFLFFSLQTTKRALITTRTAPTLFFFIFLQFKNTKSSLKTLKNVKNGKKSTFFNTKNLPNNQIEKYTYFRPKSRPLKKNIHLKIFDLEKNDF